MAITRKVVRKFGAESPSFLDILRQALRTVILSEAFYRQEILLKKVIKSELEQCDEFFKPMTKEDFDELPKPSSQDVPKFPKNTNPRNIFMIIIAQMPFRLCLTPFTAEKIR